MTSELRNALIAYIKVRGHPKRKEDFRGETDWEDPHCDIYTVREKCDCGHDRLIEALTNEPIEDAE